MILKLPIMLLSNALKFPLLYSNCDQLCPLCPSISISECSILSDISKCSDCFIRVYQVYQPLATLIFTRSCNHIFTALLHTDSIVFITHVQIHCAYSIVYHDTYAKSSLRIIAQPIMLINALSTHNAPHHTGIISIGLTIIVVLCLTACL